jgi:hypothetical protein
MTSRATRQLGSCGRRRSDKQTPEVANTRTAQLLHVIGHAQVLWSANGSKRSTGLLPQPANHEAIKILGQSSSSTAVAFEILKLIVAEVGRPRLGMRQLAKLDRLA